MGHFRNIVCAATATVLCLSLFGCSQSESPQASSDGEHSVEESLDVVYPDGTEETVTVDFYIPEDNPLTESEKGTISLFTEKFSSWGEFFSCGDPSVGLNGRSREEDPSFQRNRTGLLNSEVARPEIIVADDELATIVIVSKGVVDSGEYPGFVVAAKNNSSETIGISGFDQKSNEAAISTLNGTQVSPSMGFQVEPGCWSYGSLTFGDIDYDEFANGIIKGNISVFEDRGDLLRTYGYEC